MLWLLLSGFLIWCASDQGMIFLALVLALAEVAGMPGRLVALLCALTLLNQMLH